MQADLDVLTIGRSSVDIYPLEIGVGLEDVTTFGKFLGGSPTNVAVAASKLGRRSGVVTGVGQDPFGRYVARALREFGVDDGGVLALPDVATSLAFCEIHPPDDFPLYFYRAEPSPELRIGPDDLDLDAVRGATLLWVSASGLSREPSATMHRVAMAERAGHPGRTVLDLDYRPTFWDSPAAAHDGVGRVLATASVAVGNREECEVAVGETDPDRAADALLAAGVEIAIVKQGPRGVLGKTAHERVEVEATPCEVVNGLGAGDAFGGSLCHALLAGWSLEETLRFASAAGAIVASRLACSTAMPTESEVREVLALGRVPAGLR